MGRMLIIVGEDVGRGEGLQLFFESYGGGGTGPRAGEKTSTGEKALMILSKERGVCSKGRTYAISFFLNGKIFYERGLCDGGQNQGFSWTRAYLGGKGSNPRDSEF